MSELSLNRWPALKDGDPRLATGVVPGVGRKITMNRACLPLFLHFLAAWDKEMPARLTLKKGPLDSHEYRAARNANALSNHASGTAVDARYDVLLADNKPHLTAQEKVILDRILSRYTTKDGHRVLANGEWWGKHDGMHTELSQGWDRGAKRYTTAADVAEVTKRLGIRPDGTQSLVKKIVAAVMPKPKVALPPFPGPFGMGAQGPAVAAVQRGLGIPVDGMFGPQTRQAVIDYQNAHPALKPADGVVGPLTYKAVARP